MKLRVGSLLLLAAVAAATTATTQAQQVYAGRNVNRWTQRGFGPGILDWSGLSGYGAYGPRGYAYYPGLVLPGMEVGNGPGPYYSPEWGSLAAAPLENRRVMDAAYNAPVQPRQPGQRTGLFGRLFRRNGK